MERRKLKVKANVGKGVHLFIMSSAETTGDFNKGFDTVNLHRPTLEFRI
jgi:hypothetical protein